MISFLKLRPRITRRVFRIIRKFKTEQFNATYSYNYVNIYSAIQLSVLLRDFIPSTTAQWLTWICNCCMMISIWTFITCDSNFIDFIEDCTEQIHPFQGLSFISILDGLDFHKSWKDYVLHNKCQRMKDPKCDVNSYLMECQY